MSMLEKVSLCMMKRVALTNISDFLTMYTEGIQEFLQNAIVCATCNHIWKGLLQRSANTIASLALIKVRRMLQTFKTALRKKKLKIPST